MAYKKRISVDILASPRSAGSILYGIYDALSIPGVSWPNAVTGEPVGQLFDLRIVSATTQQFTCRSGVPVKPEASLEEANSGDVVCIPNLTCPVDQSPHGLFEAEAAWLRERYAKGATIASACSGAILLAEAGLLDGEMATSHWLYRDLFRRFYPNVTLRPERVICFAGEGKRIVTVGGMASWQELALYLIAHFLGAEEAVKTSKIFVFADRTDGQLHYAAMSRVIRHDDQIIGNCQKWLAENYAVPNPVAEMISRSGLAKRSFSRRFVRATGYPPLQYVHALRIEEAKQLLEATEVTIDEVGTEVGYQDPRSFRRLFKRSTGSTPSHYRRRFSHSRFLGDR